MLKMAQYNHFYVSVSCDVQPDGLNMACWMSPSDLWFEETNTYPHYYDRGEGDYIWHIHANCELTIKAVSMIVEYANHIVMEQKKINERRKVANR
jgi:hypothetical protein